MPKGEVAKTITSNTTDIWKERWGKQIKSKTMECLLPTLESDLPKQIMKLSRQDISIAIQYLSGHNFLLHHEKKMATGDDRKKFLNSKCRLCNREEETTEHMIFNCDALAEKRADSLGKYFLNPKKDTLNLTEVITFLKTADLTNHPIPDGHLTNLNPPSI